MLLFWSIKETFIKYVRENGGKVESFDGAEQVGTEFRFEELPKKTGDDPNIYSFHGAVHCTAHDGMLDVLIADPTVKLEDDGTGFLTIAVGETSSQQRLSIARLRRDEAGENLQFSARLTLEGARFFGDVYSPGQPLDPLRFEHDVIRPSY